MLKRFITSDLKVFFFLVLAIVVMLPSFAWSQTPVVKVATEKAHLRQEGALITAKSQEVKLKKGVNAILFKGIAPSAPTASIRVNAGESVRVLSYQWVADSNLIQDTELRRLDEEIAVQKDSLRSAIKAEKRLLYAKGVLDANVQIDVSDKSIYVDDLDELVTYYKSALRAWDKEFSILKYHKKSLNRQIDSLETAKSSLVTTLESINTALYVQLSALLEVNRTVDFTYEIESAHWKPDYFISLNGEGKADISMSARVFQDTGFDWDNVELSFEFGEGNYQKKGIAYSANYMEATEPVSIPNLSETYIFDLNKVACAYNMVSIANPNSAAHPYNSVLISNLSGFSLPKGKVTLKTISGFQKIDTLVNTLDQDTNLFSIGLDNSVLCTKSISKEKLSKSIVGGKQTLVLEWEAQLTNNGTKTHTLTYTDYLPNEVPGGVVENSLPKGSKTAANQFSCTVVIEPGESVTLPYKFQIEAPKGVNINNYYTK